MANASSVNGELTILDCDSAMSVLSFILDFNANPAQTPRFLALS
jgi:hypothetical protein